MSELMSGAPPPETRAGLLLIPSLVATQPPPQHRFAPTYQSVFHVSICHQSSVHCVIQKVTPPSVCSGGARIKTSNNLINYFSEPL